MGVSQNQGYHFGGRNNKDYSFLKSKVGSPYIGAPLLWETIVGNYQILFFVKEVEKGLEFNLNLGLRGTTIREYRRTF